MADNIMTGFKMIDNEFGGLWNKEVTLIGGRPAMGKTSFALNIALNVAMKEKRKVLFISAERGIADMELRLLSMLSGIPLIRIRKWEMSDEEWKLFIKTVNEVKNLPIEFRYATTIWAIKYFAKSLKEEGFDLLVFDYIQLINKDCYERRERTVCENLIQFKKLAKKYDVPVVVLTQLSKKLEKRKDRHPRIKDIKGRGIKKEYYDQAFLLYREWYYDIDAPSSTAELIGFCNDNKTRLIEKMDWSFDNCSFNSRM